MPYVPPHLRAGDANRRPEAMGSSSSSSPLNYPSIRSSRTSIRRLLVLSRLGARLRFDRFTGLSYFHLQGADLHTVCIDREQNDQGDAVLDDSTAPSLARIQQQLSEDLVAAIESARLEIQRAQSDVLVVRPKLVVRFGKLLFQNFKRWRTDSHEELLDGGALERALLDGKCRKTFDTGIPEDVFNDIKKLVLEDAVQVFSKETFFIRAEDTKHSVRNPVRLRCKCVARGTCLEMKKVQHEPLRHMVNDVLCLEKKCDLRIMVLSEGHVSLLDDERAGLDAIVNAAVVNDDVKGGLHWPLAQKSRTNRFKVVGVFRLHQTTARTQQKVWSFVVARRAEFEKYSERVSYEAEFKDVEFRDYVALSECKRDDLMQLVTSTIDTAEKHL